MVGRRIEAMFPPKRDDSPLPEPALVVSGFSVPGTAVEGVELTVSPGEIVGLAGLAGNGQNEILEGISGIRPSRGEVVVGSHRGPFRSPSRARRAGVWLVPEDRKRHGLLLALSIGKNLTLPTLDRVSRFGFLDPASGGRRRLRRHRGDVDPSAVPRPRGAVPLRRQPAEDRDRQGRRGRPRRLRLRRPHPRDRRRHQGRDLPAAAPAHEGGEGRAPALDRPHRDGRALRSRARGVLRAASSRSSAATPSPRRASPRRRSPA